MTHFLSRKGITGLPRRIFRWIVRFRQRRGYGIHSPFAFGLVNDVVYCPGHFYDDKQIEKMWKENPTSSLRLKDCKFLFRLANFVHPAHCALVSVAAESLVAKCLSTGSAHTHYDGQPPTADLIVVADWEGKMSELLERSGEGCVLLLLDIGSTKSRRNTWRKICKDLRKGVTFDLHDFGIIFCRTDLPRQNYVINYF